MENRELLDIDINRYLLMFKRQWLSAALVFTTIVSSSIVTTTFLKPTYEASGKLLFRTPSFQVVEGDSRGGLSSLSRQNPINNQIQLIYSSDFLQQVVEKLNLKDPNGLALDHEVLVPNLTLKIVPGTDVLRVSYTDRSSKQAAAIVNMVMELYLENEVTMSNSEAVETRKFLTSRLPRNRSEVNIAALALRKFKQENGITDIVEESREIIASYGRLNSEINSIKSQIQDLKAQGSEIQSQLAINTEQAINISSINQSTVIQEILRNIQQVDIELAKEKGRFLDNNPVIISLEAQKANLQNVLKQQLADTLGKNTNINSNLLQIGELRQNLLQNLVQIKVQTKGLEEKMQSLVQSREIYKERLILMPKLEQKLRELEQKVEIAKSTYTSILTKIQELQLAEKKETGNGRIVAKALVPDKPLASKKLLVVGLGLIFGIAFSAIVVLLIELRDKHIKNIEEIKQKLPYTLLGTLPQIQKKNIPDHTKLIYPDLTVINAPQSAISEMYRMIQANLKFLSSDKSLQTIVITSAIPQEGKSTVSANLGAAIAQLGRRVLLIDADMRIPSQHKIWKISNYPGLSDVLVGQTEFSHAVCTIIQNLDILPSGVQPPNPLALIDSKRMASFVAELRSKYDFIIIDSPPFLLTADAFTLSKICDGILLVARPGVLDYNNATLAQEMLKSSDQNILGLVVNGLIENNEPSNYFANPYEYVMSKDVVNKEKIKTSTNI